MKKTGLVIVAIATLFACKKSERLQENAYEPLDSFYDMYEEEVQEFIIDSVGEGPIVGEQGTNAYVGAQIFMMPDGSDVEYPFKLQMVEIYEKDQMMLSRAPSAFNTTTALITGGMVSIRAFKDTTELVLRPGAVIPLKYPEKHGQSTVMTHYYGERGADHVLDLMENVANEATLDSLFYHVYADRVGFSSPSRAHATGASQFLITLSVQGTGTENIAKYVVYNNTHTVLKIRDVMSSGINEGTSVKLVCFAKNQDGEFLLHEEDLEMNANKNVELNFQTVTEADLIATLEAY